MAKIGDKVVFHDRDWCKSSGTIISHPFVNTSGWCKGQYCVTLRETSTQALCNIPTDRICGPMPCGISQEEYEILAAGAVIDR